MMNVKDNINFSKTQFYKSFGEYKQLPPPENSIEIAFSGRSNVGKSTLINKLCNRKALARVSSMPGKTVTINFYNLDDIYIVDLPGYGYAKRSKEERKRWSPLVEGYLTAGRISLLVQLIDIRHSPSKEDFQMIDFLVQTKMPFIIVFTKADKLSKTARKERMVEFANEIENFEDITHIAFSSLTGEGVEELQDKLRSVIYDTKCK